MLFKICTHTKGYTFKKFLFHTTNLSSFNKYTHKSTYEPNENFLKKIKTKTDSYYRLMRLNNPVGNWLVITPGIWSLALFAPAAGCVNGIIPITLLAKFIVGGALIRTSQCIINDLIDYKIDRNVARTESRPLSTNEVSKFEALLLCGGLLSCALCILLTLPVKCQVVGVLGAGLMTLYPYTKRFMRWPGLFLGATNSLAVPMGLLAYSSISSLSNDVIVSSFMPQALSLFVAHTFFNATYEAFYSYQDYVDDKKMRLNSFAQLFGLEHGKKAVGSMMSVVIASLMASGYYSEQTWPYYASLALCSALYYKQYKSFDPRDGSNLFSLFASSAVLGTIVYLGLVGGNFLKKEETKQSKQIKNE